MNKNLAILALIVSTIIWGANVTIMKVTLASVPPFSLGFIRFFGAALLLFPFVFGKIRLKDLSPIVLLTGLIGITGTLSLFFLGLRLTSALNAGIITAFSPLLILIAAHVLLKEKLKKNILFGASLGILGIGIIIGKDLTQNLALSPLGDFLVLLAIFGSVFYSIYSKKISDNISPILRTFYVLGIGGLGFLPGALWEWQINSSWVSNIPQIAILGVLYAMLFSSLVAHSFWQWGLSRMDAGKAGVFGYLEPVVTTVTAVIFLSERITLAFAIGALFIFSGLLIAEVHRQHHPPHHR